MKKSHRPTSDSRSDSNEQATRLYRAISDVARHLDDHRSRAECVRELFAQSIEVQRVKLREYCDRLMFTDPVNYGRKAEEILWRKGFYEVVTTVKRLNKAGMVDQLDLALVLCHLQTGIGHYHHLIMKIQTHYRLDLRGIADFPILITDLGLKKDFSVMFPDKTWWTVKAIESGALEWAHQAVHRCLIYLGDLSRYISDFDSSHDNSLATRYYAQALNWKPESGVPHNQLGTMATGKNFGLDTTYHYMRSICCIQKFEGTEGNLQHLMDNNARTLDEIRRSKELPSTLQKLIVGFMYITYSLFCDKPCPLFNQLCNEVMSALNTCLTEIEPPSSTLKTNGEMPKLTDSMIFKMVVISIMCIERLKAKGSSMTVGGMALTLALISQVIRCAVSRIEAALPPREAPTLKNGRQRRRRRRRRSVSQPSSDLSEDDTESICSADSDISEEDLIFDQYHESDEDFHANGNGVEKGFLNGFNTYPEDDNRSNLSSEKNGPVNAWHHPLLLDSKTFQHIHKISQEGYIMQTIKVCCDWLSDNVGLIKSCGPSCGLLISRLVTFFNHLSLIPNYKAMKEHLEPDTMPEEVLWRISLPEDVRVRGLAGLQTTQSELDWDFLRIKVLESKQETYTRVYKLLRFGVKMAQVGEVGLNYNEPKLWFSTEIMGKKSPKENVATDLEGERERLMQEMGQLWLKAEVDELESKTRKSTSLPPYLVLDTDAFIHHPSLVKQLTAAKKFILVIPTVVVSALDEQKRSSGRVRDTIRWLESQLRHGNRFLRAQRANEHLALPLIKYPKKKDKEALMFFQIVECCHYLSQQSTGDKNSELVTLITGSRTMMTNNHSGFSPLGVAKSAGLNVEHIETFYSKWKSSSKSHG